MASIYEATLVSTIGAGSRSASTLNDEAFPSSSLKKNNWFDPKGSRAERTLRELAGIAAQQA